jgi:hypothetical protein
MKKVVTTQAVDMALRTLDSEGVERVRAWFDRLRNWDRDEFVRTHSRLLEGFTDTYVLQTSSDIRIFFRIEGDTIAIVDIAKKPAIVTSGHVSKVS